MPDVFHGTCFFCGCGAAPSRRPGYVKNCKKDGAKPREKPTADGPAESCAFRGESPGGRAGTGVQVCLNGPFGLAGRTFTPCNTLEKLVRAQVGNPLI